MKNRVQRQLIYRVMWNDKVLSTNIVPLSVTRHLSIWQFSHDSWRGESLQGRSIGVKNTMLTLSALIGRNTDAIRGLVHRNMGRGLIGWFIKSSRAVLFHCKPSTVRQIGHFCSRLRFLMRTQGEKGTTLYLKSCQVLLQQSIAGYKVSDITELKSRVNRTKAGMPRIIPAGVRRRIREGDTQSIRLWMTLLGMYRILQFRGKLNLSTITDPGKRLSNSYMERWESFISSIYFPTLQKVFTPQSKVELPQPQPFPILKSGPQTVEDQVMKRGTVSSSFYSLVRSAKAWQATELKKSLRDLLVLWSAHNFRGTFPPIMERLGWAASNNWRYTGDESFQPDAIVVESGPAKNLAKLGFKEEAAGKVRVFAMVDPWTQWVMKPIHEAIFTILRGIPMDGTFDQPKPVERLRSLSVKDRWFFSIDLSAATDRLPIKLQIPVMEGVFKWVNFPDAKKASTLWADLLVNRAYKVVIPSTGYNFEIPSDLPSSVTYSVGQPMGALSSWAMLALTHHAIVQWAAHRAKARYPNAVIPIAFRDYAVLGDDVVIANRYVAREYLMILKEIGVTAGLAKSIISRGSFYLEFAKKFFTPSGRADMLPLKEVIATLSSTLLVCEFVRQHNLNISQILTVLGYGYKTKSRAISALYLNLNRRLRTLLIWFRSPKGAFPLPVGRWIRSSGWNYQWDVADDHPAWGYIWEELMERVQVLMNRYYDASEKFRKEAESAGKLRPTDQEWLKKGLPISRCPPFLTERTEVDPGSNSVFKSRISFKHLVSPIDWEVHDETQGGESLNWFLRLNMNYSHMSKSVDREPIVILPESLIKADLFEQVFAINDETKTDKLLSTKCEELTTWIFDFDKIAQDIPTAYWPQIRAGEKPMREFIETAKIHEIFSKYFNAFRLNPRLKPVATSDFSGNTPFSLQNMVSSDPWLDGTIGSNLNLVPIEGTENSFNPSLGGDSLKLLKLRSLVTFKANLSQFNHSIIFLRSYKWLIEFNRFIRDMIILASLVYLCPLYETGELLPPVAEGVHQGGGGEFLFLLALLVMTALTFGGLSYYLWLSSTDFELSAIDLISRQAQQISEHEVRLMRMHAERLDLEDIIEGLETTIETLSST